MLLKLQGKGTEYTFYDHHDISGIVVYSVKNGEQSVYRGVYHDINAFKRLLSNIAKEEGQ